MKGYIISALEYALTGVDEVDQNIFENYKNREEVKFHVANIEQECEEEEKDRKQSSNTDKNESGKNEGDKRIDERGTHEQTEVVETFRRDVRRLKLTRTGKKLYNTMMDHCYCVRATDFDLDELFQIDRFPYPNINLTKLMNVSRRSFYDADAELFNEGRERMLLNYPKFDGMEVEDIEWEYHDGEVELMDPEEFERTWKRIIRVSKRLNDVQMNQKLTKPVLYWENLKCAYDEQDRLVVRFGTTPTSEEKLLAQLIKPYWSLNPIQFGKPEREGHYSKLDIQEWLVSSQDSNKEQKNNNKNSDNNNQSNKRNRLNNKGKKNNNNKNNNTNNNNSNQAQPQPENNAKANANNPAAQGGSDNSNQK